MATALPLSGLSSSYRGVEDRELVALARNGDTEASAEIVRRYRGLMVNVARRMGRRAGQDIDDLVQEAAIGLLEAISTYRHEAVRFPAYAQRCVRNKVAKAVCRQTLPTDDALAPDVATTRSTEDDVLDHLVLTDILRFAERTLTDLECAAIVGSMIGLPQKTTARIVGTTPTKLNRAFRRAVRLIWEILNTEIG